MNRKLGLLTLFYGFRLACAGAVAFALKLDAENSVALCAGVGGGLCMLWGLLGTIGFRSILGPSITLGTLAFWLVTHTTNGWLAFMMGKPVSILVTIVSTLFLLGAIGLLVALTPKEKRPSALDGPRP